MSRNVKGFMVFLAAFLLQFFLNALLGGKWTITPNLILCLSGVLTYLYQDCLVWVIYGCLFTFLMDLNSAMYVGSGLASIIAVLLVALLFRYVFNAENFLNALAFSVIITIVYYLTYWLISFVLGSPYSLTYVMIRIPVQLLLNSCISLIIWKFTVRKVAAPRHGRYLG